MAKLRAISPMRIKRTCADNTSQRKRIGRFPLRLATSVICAVSILCCPLTADGSWVDPDTPQSKRSTKPFTLGDEREFELVFSDEFEEEGRTFNDGKDPRWTSIQKNDYTNAALHFYSNENAFTSNGVLNITSVQKVNTYKAFNEKKKTYYMDKKHVQTGMVQGWNKFCYVGGIVEISAKLPGNAHTGGLWPALWLLGNLARATYVGSTDYVWPFSYNECSPEKRGSQKINACSKANHFGLAEYTGRGSPEIDVIEAMQGEPGKLPNTFIQRPYQSASLQVSPGIEIDRPVLGRRPHPGHWYNDLEYGANNMSDLNPFFYGVTLVHDQKSKTYQSDAISANMQLNDTNYETQVTYRVEWEPPASNGTGGYIKWFTDGEMIFSVHGDSLGIMGTEIPSEPMYLIMNTAVSHTWGFPAPCPEGCDCKCYECGNPKCACALPSGYCDNFPASFEIDYVRVFQSKDEPKHILGCSPESRPTAQYIEGHKERFMAEGETRPLQPVADGGAPCAADDECGGSKRGTCTIGGYCKCSKNTTGPNCLAHKGFYDFDTSLHPEPFSYRHIRLSHSLTVLVGCLLAGFLVSLLSTVKKRSREPKYQKVPAAAQDMSFQSAPSGTAMSYQQSGSSGSKKKDMTYCVIDGRLVDQ